MQRDEAEKEVVERVDQLLLADAHQPARLELFAGDDPEVLKDSLEQILLGEKRVQHKRGERRSIDLLEQRATQRRFAGPDVAGDDDEPFAAADGVLQQIERPGVRLAAIQIFWVR